MEIWIDPLLMCRTPRTRRAPNERASRFWRRVIKRGADECWLWRGALTTGGYGAFSLRGKQITASRRAYELAYGPIPPGLCAAATIAPAATPRTSASGRTRTTCATWCRVTGGVVVGREKSRSQPRWRLLKRFPCRGLATAHEMRREPPTKTASRQPINQDASSA